MLRLGGIGEDFLADIAVINDIIAKAKFLIDNGGQWLNPVGVDLRQLLDPAEDIVEFRRKPVNFLVTHRDPGKLCDMADLIMGYRHGRRIAAGNNSGKIGRSKASSPGDPERFDMSKPSFRNKLDGELG